MISECPNCNQAFNFSDSHKEKLFTALNRLAPGKTLKFGCPRCKTPIEIGSDGELAPKEPPLAEKPLVVIEPPRPQDLKWLASGEKQVKEMADNVPTALVLMPDGPEKIKITHALEENGFQIYLPGTVDEAVGSIRFKDFSVVAYHSEYERYPLKDHDFHRFMTQMSMSKRRSIYYILIGPEFQTLYDLEALSLSANLVINPKETGHFSTLFKKGKKDMDTLFAPYANMLKKHGKN